MLIDPHRLLRAEADGGDLRIVEDVLTVRRVSNLVLADADPDRNVGLEVRLEEHDHLFAFLEAREPFRGLREAVDGAAALSEDDPISRLEAAFDRLDDRHGDDRFDARAVYLPARLGAIDDAVDDDGTSL